MELLICVVLTYLAIQYVFPLFDLLFEFCKYAISDKVGIIQVRMESRVKEFELKYPEEKPELSPAIGFHMSNPEGEIEEEDKDDEDCELNKNKIGFHK